MKCALQVPWQPEQIEPPDGIGEELGDGESPGFPCTGAAELKGTPARLSPRDRFGSGQVRMPSIRRECSSGLPIEPEPEGEPDESGGAGDDEASVASRGVRVSAGTI